MFTLLKKCFVKMMQSGETVEATSKIFFGHFAFLMSYRENISINIKRWLPTTISQQAINCLVGGVKKTAYVLFFGLFERRIDWMAS